LEAEVGRGEDAEQVAVGEQEGVAFGLAGAGDDAGGAFTDLFDGFAVGDAVAPEVPAWAGLADVGGAFAFVVAVVPLHQVGVEEGAVTEAGKACGFAGAEQGACQDELEVDLRETGRELAGAVFAFFGQGEVGVAGVGAGEAPGGFPVADEPEFFLHATILAVSRAFCQSSIPSTFGPGADGEFGVAHGEAVAAGGVDVHLGGNAVFLKIEIEVGCGDDVEVVIVGADEE
jgi:hypothetical protein